MSVTRPSRTASMTAVGVINLIVGTLATLSGAAVSYIYFRTSAMVAEIPALAKLSGVDPGLTDAAARAETALQILPLRALGMLIFGVLLMISARGLLVMRPWARLLSLSPVGLAIAWLIGMMPFHVMQGGLARADIGFLLYWILVAVLLNSREWKLAYDQRPDLAATHDANLAATTA